MNIFEDVKNTLVRHKLQNILQLSFIANIERTSLECATSSLNEPEKYYISFRVFKGKIAQRSAQGFAHRDRSIHNRERMLFRAGFGRYLAVLEIIHRDN